MFKRTILSLSVGVLALAPWSASALAGAGPGVAAGRSVALRAGWAYGAGGEFEYRPGTWGVGMSGGYVPSLGAGGYAGLQWGARPLGFSGPVAEAGLFRGVHNPLRAAATGAGLYVLAGYEFAPTPGTSIRIVAGEGLPFADTPAFPSFEFLAKLTAGIVL